MEEGYAGLDRGRYHRTTQDACDVHVLARLLVLRTVLYLVERTCTATKP